jgi:hypothetical protein
MGRLQSSFQTGAAWQRAFDIAKSLKTSGSGEPALAQVTLHAFDFEAEQRTQACR